TLATDHADVAGHPHHPAHAGNPEQRFLRHPLHLPRQVRDEEDVGVRLVIAHRDVRTPRVTHELPCRLEPPERIQLHREHRDQPEQPARGVAPRIERRRDGPDDGHQRRADDDRADQYRPDPRVDEKDHDSPQARSQSACQFLTSFFTASLFASWPLRQRSTSAGSSASLAKRSPTSWLTLSSPILAANAGASTSFSRRRISRRITRFWTVSVCARARNTHNERPIVYTTSHQFQ